MKETYKVNKSGLSLDGYIFPKNSIFCIESEKDLYKQCKMLEGYAYRPYCPNINEGKLFTLTNQRLYDALNKKQLTRYIDGVIDNEYISETYNIF